jgi:hypothetical protein
MPGEIPFTNCCPDKGLGSPLFIRLSVFCSQINLHFCGVWLTYTIVRTAPCLSSHTVNKVSVINTIWYRGIDLAHAKQMVFIVTTVVLCSLETPHPLSHNSHIKMLKGYAATQVILVFLLFLQHSNGH